MMTYGNSYKWVLKQGLVVLGGAIAIFLISRADYRIIKGHKPAFLCLGIATFSMIVVLLVGAAKKGSVRWISIAGFQIQPSEFCKFLLIIYMANELAINASQHKLKTLGDHAKILVPTIPVIGLVTYQNLSTCYMCYGWNHDFCGKPKDERIDHNCGCVYGRDSRLSYDC